jgi:hypothetical protein
MSAYIVDRNHIRYLVSAAQSRVILGSSAALRWSWKVNRKEGTMERAELTQHDRDRAGEVGNMLWSENVKSVSARYPNDKPSELPGPCQESFDYAHSRPWPCDEIDAVQVLKACDALEYQSCEHDGWPESEACAFLEALRRAAWHALPGYDKAEWGAPKTREQRRAA